MTQNMKSVNIAPPKNMYQSCVLLQRFGNQRRMYAIQITLHLAFSCLPI